MNIRRKLANFFSNLGAKISEDDQVCIAQVIDERYTVLLSLCNYNKKIYIKYQIIGRDYPIARGFSEILLCEHIDEVVERLKSGCLRQR